MRIALVTDSFKTGGGLEHIYQIAKGIPDIEFLIFGEKGEGIEKFNGLLNVKLFPDGFTPALVLKHKPDIVHIHHLRPLASFFLNPLYFYKIPIIFTVHGLHIHKYEFIKRFSSRPRYILRFYLEKYLFHRVTRIISVSKEDREFLIERYNLNGQKVGYIPNGIDCTKIENIKLPKQEVRDVLNLPKDCFIFLTVARFDFQKGYDVLVKAVALIKNYLKNKKVKFVLVGSGEELENIKKLVQEEGIDRYFVFAGNRQDVHLFLKAADCFILPSRWEGLPIALIEAGYAKLPVIASNTYGNREVIDDKQTGVMFINECPYDLSLKIRDFMENYSEALIYGLELYRKVKKEYSLEKMVRELRNLYEELKS